MHRNEMYSESNLESIYFKEFYEAIKLLPLNSN